MPDFQPRLEVHAIWRDADLVELRIIAFSEHFAGRVDVYATCDQLREFANCVSGFPANLTDIRRFEFETSPHGNRASFRFSVINSRGLAVLDAEITETQDTQETARIRLFIEPAAIDEFAAQLHGLVMALDGSAMLPGRIGAFVARML